MLIECLTVGAHDDWVEWFMEEVFRNLWVASKNHFFAILWLISVSFSAKNSPTSDYVAGALSWSKSQFFLPQMWSFLADWHPQFGHNLQVMFFIGCWALWQELVMQHAPKIKENCKQIPHSRANLVHSFRSCSSFHCKNLGLVSKS